MKVWVMVPRTLPRVTMGGSEMGSTDSNGTRHPNTNNVSDGLGSVRQMMTVMACADGKRIGRRTTPRTHGITTDAVSYLS